MEETGHSTTALGLQPSLQPPIEGGVQARFRVTSTTLIDAMRAVMQSLSDRPSRAVEIERSLGIGRNIAHRFARALAEEDIIEAIHVGPGPVPLRQILRAAERRGADRTLLADARTALRAFEELIDVHAGDRSTLDVMMGGWLSPVRDRIDLLARQSIHRGFANIRGCTSRLQLIVAFINPSETNANSADGLTCECFRNLVRLRSGARVRCGSFNRLAPDGTSRTLRLDGTPAESARDVMLSQWCTMSPEAFRFASEGNSAAIELSDHQLGLSMPVNVAVALRYNSCVTLTRPADVAPGVGPLADIQLPTEQLVFDVYIDPNLFPGQTPRLVIRDTAAERTMPKTKPHRSDAAAFETDSHFVPLAPSRAAHKLFPDYALLLDEVARHTRWPIAGFRAFRAFVRYPIYGSIVHAYFDRPVS